MALQFATVRPLKAGVLAGTNAAAGESVTATESNFTFGGSANLLGDSWTYSDINASNFGVSLMFSSSGGNSSNLQATNFGFSIPSDQTILGIQFNVYAKSSGAGTNSATISVNYVTATITTTLTTFTSYPKFFQLF